MTLATILSRTQQGLEAPLVRVEVHVGSGLPAFSIVGLPETAVKESKDRVRAALANCGFDLPSGHITVNLVPAKRADAQLAGRASWCRPTEKLVVRAKNETGTAPRHRNKVAWSAEV